MKKVLSILLLVILSNMSFAQESQEFAQLMLETELTIDIIRDLDESIREKEQVFVCRIDIPTKRVFILSNPGFELTESMIQSWFQEKSASFRCFYKGIYKLDPVQKFPFQNCDQ
jgi:hypothetical protein